MHFDDARSASYCRQLGTLAKAMCSAKWNGLNSRNAQWCNIISLCCKSKPAGLKLDPYADNNEHGNVFIDYRR